MDEISAMKFTETRSRFFAHLYRIDEEDDLESILKKHRKDYRKARHHCYAARFSENGEMMESFKNDGEVGHPGQVLLEILKKEELDSHCLMVSRIFGGVNLGVGGVSRAFRNAGQAAVEMARKR